jgi:sulfofructose kinase
LWFYFRTGLHNGTFLKASELSKVDLVGVGLNATDTLILVPEYPDRGSKVESDSVNTLPGGQVASAVMACQRWGLRTRYVGKLGDDLAGALHRKEFARAGVETQIISVPTCASQQAFILVDSEGERTVLWRRDEQLALHPTELNREWIVNARALHVDGYDTAAATTAAAWARAAGIPVIADLDDVYPDVEALLENVDYLIVSRDFPERLCGEARLEKSLPLLHRRFGSRVTAATLGSDGVLAWDGKQFLYACAYRVPVVDTTGAGDTFHAGFIYGLLQGGGQGQDEGLPHGWTIQRQLDFACAAAALNCTAVGARGGIKPVEAIENLMAIGPRYPALCDLAQLA